MNYTQIIENYIKWIKDNTEFKSIRDDKVCGVTTPFLDRHNDHIQIYIQKKEEKYILTDDGYTIDDLKMSGVEVNTPKRQKTLTTILNGYGVKVGENNDLYIESNIQNIGQKKHYLLQAILSINDMYVLSQESVYSFFKEDVEIYFKSNNLFYTKDIKITGKTGFDHNIDFIVPHSADKPERLIKTINVPNKDYIMASIFAFTDILSAREQKSNNYIIFNDTEKKPSIDITSAMRSYGIKDIPWTQREKCIEEFALTR